jgi:hypothetical protein
LVNLEQKALLERQQEKEKKKLQEFREKVYALDRSRRFIAYSYEHAFKHWILSRV